MKTLKFQRIEGHCNKSVPVFRKTAIALQSLDQRDFDRMFTKAFHSVRKAIEGQGITPIPADVEIAASQAISLMWERASTVDKERKNFYFRTRIRLPLQAFINSKARQVYYDMMKRPGESRRSLATTELHGKAAHDKHLTDIEFYESLQHVKPLKLQLLADLIIDGYSKSEAAIILKCSRSNVSRLLAQLGEELKKSNEW